MGGRPKTTSTKNAVLVNLFEHHKWSNLQIIDFCATLTDEQLALTGPGVYGNTLDTLKHIVANEAHYLRFLDGSHQVVGIDQRKPFSGWERLQEVALQTGDALIAFAGPLDGDPVQRGVNEGVAFAIPTSVFLAQVINHATEHRSHIRTVLSSHGIELPESDGWHWLETLPADGQSSREP
ncbi:MAG: DinB family protein [Thermomicrobiales bacterium]